MSASTDQGLPVCQPTGLPFTLEGVTCDHALVEVPAAPPPLDTPAAWSLGGDFRVIASAAVDALTVFGSVTDRPDDLRSYSAGLIHADGRTERLGDISVSDGKYREPQDGSVSSKWIVWRLGTIDDSGSTDNAVDDWTIMAFDRSTSTIHELATAEDTIAQGRRDARVSEAVPSASAGSVYFATATANGNDIVPTVLRFPLPATTSQPAVPIRLDGTAVAATKSGALLAHGSDGSHSSTALSFLAEGEDSLVPVMKVGEDGNGWHWAGVWSNGTSHAALVTTQDSADSWIGVFSGDGTSAWTWYHSPTPVSVVSLSDRYLVWGSGSMGGIDDGWMYLVDRSDSTPWLLGRAPGYARPSLAPDGSVVLVPRSDGIEAVHWDVISLP